MFEKIIYENIKITTITLAREADLTESMSVLKNFYDDSNAEHLMLNIRLCSFDDKTRDQIRELCEYAASRANGESRINGKIALVGSIDLQFEICRVFKRYSEMIGSTIEVSVFRSIMKAFRWLVEG